jgi:hypothetical protein
MTAGVEVDSWNDDAHVIVQESEYSMQWLQKSIAEGGHLRFEI